MLVHLASWLSFERARQLLADLVGIQVSASSSRRYRYPTGQALLEIEQAGQGQWPITTTPAALPVPNAASFASAVFAGRWLC